MIKYHLVKGRKRWIMSILMLHPVFKDAIWGGKLLKNFGYEEAGDNAGECWGMKCPSKRRLHSCKWRICRQKAFMVL